MRARSLASALTTARTSSPGGTCGFCGLTAGGIARNHGENDPIAAPDGLAVGHQVVHHVVADPGDADQPAAFPALQRHSPEEEKPVKFRCLIDAARIDRPLHRRSKSLCTVG